MGVFILVISSILLFSVSSPSVKTSVTNIMGVPEVVLERAGALPDMASMSKDELTALCKQLHDQSCTVFAEKFHKEYQVKKTEVEIQNLEQETSESHGTFKVPSLKKVNKFKMLAEEEA